MSYPVAVLAITDKSLRERLARTLSSLCWSVVETGGGAEALAQLQGHRSQAVIVDRWLPDLDVSEFHREIRSIYPDIDLISVDGSLPPGSAKSSRHGELMHALRLSGEWDGAAYSSGRSYSSRTINLNAQTTPAIRTGFVSADLSGIDASNLRSVAGSEYSESASSQIATLAMERTGSDKTTGSLGPIIPLPEFLGNHPTMLEVSRRIRLVAGRKTSVLVQGPTGTGKELVAKAIHRLSPRSSCPFIVINCAAIPESLLEAELFGHTRGAFTGAVQGRIGRIESANGGTLFLDEIGEMPLSLQAKLLRFLEAGEIQRVGDNQITTVDVRIVAATHQSLSFQVRDGKFREDVFYRLAVFVIKTPALADHAGDIPLLANLFLEQICQANPSKKLSEAAMRRLMEHSWPGNVRELAHLIERAYILAESSPQLTAEHIEYEETSGKVGTLPE